MLPCGCSNPQVGGLERRYNFLQTLKAAGWPYVAVDLGDIPQRHGPAGLPNQQGLIKYFYSMTALKAMDYTAVAFGEYEVNLGLAHRPGRVRLESTTEPRVVVANLIDAEKNFPHADETWEAAVTVEASRSASTGIVGPRTATTIKTLTRGDKKVRFEETTRR